MPEPSKAALGELERWADWFDNPNETATVVVPIHHTTIRLTPGYLLRAIVHAARTQFKEPKP